MSAPASLPEKIRLVRIYSNYHGAWWAPHYRGYRTNPARAGIFRYEDTKAKYPKIDYDTSKRDYLVDYELSLKDIIQDVFTLPEDELHDKYMGILSSDEAELEALTARVNGVVESVLSEWLVEVRPIVEVVQ